MRRMTLISIALILVIAVTGIIAVTAQEQGSISGTVMGRGNDVVADATVTATGTDGTALSTTTDANGDYAFEDVPFGFYSIEVDAPGYEKADPQGISIDANNPERQVDFRLVGNNSIAGQVMQALMQQPVVGAQVMAKGQTDGEIYAVVTGENGKYTFENMVKDTYNVYVFATDYRPSAAQEVKVVPQSYTGDVDFEIYATSTIQGDVLRAGGQPVTNALVVLAGMQTYFVTTSADGTYTISNIALPDNYQLGVASADVMFPSEIVSIAEGGRVVTKDLISYEGTISGSVTGSDGETLIAGANVTLKLNYPNYIRVDRLPTRQEFKTTTDAQGNFEFNGIQPGLNYLVWASAPNQGTTMVDVVFPETDEEVTADIVMGEPGSIKGTLMATDGRTPIEEAMIGFELLDPTGSRVLTDYVETDENGEFEMQNIAVGTYRISATILTDIFFDSEELPVPFASAFLVAKQPEVQVVSGEMTEVEMEVERRQTTDLSGTITGREILPPNSPIDVRFVSDGLEAVAFAGTDGIYAITGLPIGTYDVILYAPGLDPQTIEDVEIRRSDHTMDFDLTPAASQSSGS